MGPLSLKTSSPPTFMIYKSTVDDRRKAKTFIGRVSCISIARLAIMAGGVMAKMGLSHRILRWDSGESDEFSGDPAAALNISADTIFGFLDEGSEGSLGSNSDDNGCGEINEQEEDEEEEDERCGNNSEEDKSFWENQNQLLHVSLIS